MAFYLATTSTTSHVTIPSGMTGDAGTSAYTIEFRASFPTVPAGDRLLLGATTGTAQNGVGITTGGRLQIFTANTPRYFTAGGFIIFDTTRRTYRLEHDASGAWRAYRDGVLFGSGTFSTSTSFGAFGLMFRIHPTSGGYLACNLEYVEVTGLTNAQKWDANLSGGVGSTLPTVSGANQGTLVNFTVPDCWVFYSSGATYQLTAQGGTFTYSGQTAALNRGFKLAAQGGTYSYTGASANLSYTTATIYRLDALGASYSYVGASASLLRGFKLAAQGGTYSYAGSDAVLRRGFKLAANGGAYNYAGADASLTYVAGPTVYRLTALGVTYVYSGAGAALTATGVAPAANQNAFHITAQISGPQNISAMIGGTLTNNAKIGGNMTISARLSQ